MAHDLTLIIGGARSGKSALAEREVTALPPPWIYIATAEAHDDEMAARLTAHRARRGEGWEIVEAPLDLAGALAALAPGRAALADCLTLWLTNHMLGGSDLDAETERLLAALAARRGPVWLVSNEVGLGIVPDNALGRAFRDAQGRLNQRVAAAATRVFFVAAGLPLVLK